MSFVDKFADVKVDTDFQAAGCFCVWNDKLLMIQRQRNKSFEFHWAIPTGKLEKGETPRDCMVRELEEELGVRVNANELEGLGDFIVQHEDVVFEYVAFVLRLDHEPSLRLKHDEIRRYDWVSVEHITKRRVVPYFYNTVRALLDRLNDRPRLPLMVPELEAKSAKRRSA